MFEAHTDFHQLAIRLKSADEDAYDYIIRANTRLVIGYLTTRGFSLDDARDIWSDCKLKLWETLCDGYDPKQSAFPTWLLKVIRNLANDRLRKNRKKQLVALAEAEKRPAPNSIDQRWSGKRDLELVENAISALSKVDQDVLALRAQGYTNKEIARILNTSAAAVGMRITRAVKTLQTKVGTLNAHEPRRKHHRSRSPDPA
jgi:RNA polymerase sigma factor (sigma-70 family)